MAGAFSFGADRDAPDMAAPLLLRLAARKHSNTLMTSILPTIVLWEKSMFHAYSSPSKSFTVLFFGSALLE